MSKDNLAASTSLRGPSLCWKCANSVPSLARGTGCEWSENFNPVPGWTAVEVKNADYRDDESPGYHVISCPKFKPFADVYRRKQD